MCMWTGMTFDATRRRDRCKYDRAMLALIEKHVTGLCVALALSCGGSADQARLGWPVHAALCGTGLPHRPARAKQRELQAYSSV